VCLNGQPAESLPVGPASELVVWSPDRRWCTYVVGPCTIVYVCSAPRAAERYVLPRHQRGVGPSSTAAGDLPAGGQVGFFTLYEHCMRHSNCA
jgi:hypothetical protein